MKNILDYTLADLSEIVKQYGEPQYRAKQLHDALLNGNRFANITTIPKTLIAKLQDEYFCQVNNIQTIKSVDGTVKYLFELGDNNCVEAVFLPNDYGNTVCVSTQVGCAMNCAFCASGIQGVVRNLTHGEILGQVVAINALYGGTVSKRAISNIVLMGSGEPLDNYDNVIKFIQFATDKDGLNISKRSISLSTCGIVDKIYELADSVASGVILSISLHASTDESRQSIMPIAKTTTIAELIKAAKYYFDKTSRRILIEYALIKGVNTNHFDAKRLAELLKGVPCHINLIRLNPVKEKNLLALSEQQSIDFCNKLKEFGMSATIRKKQGADILSACGQLRAKHAYKK